MISRLVFYFKELRREILEYFGKTIFKPIRIYRRTKLLNDNFSIISNNCWGGVIYQKLNLPYLSPTVGTYFYAEDYIKFLSNLEYYLSITPKIIPINQSKYSKELSELKVYKYFPIGVIDDIEIIFLHYRSDQEAISKWERRKKRINMENLIIKFNDQNQCTYEHLKKFESLEYDNKICFTAKEYYGCENLIVVKQKKSDFIKSDISFFKKPIDIIKYINNITIS